MLKYVKGDLIKAAQMGDINVIAHCCNCYNTMGSGIAPQIARAFPEAEMIDKQSVRGDKNKLGGFSVATSGDIVIFNLYGQYGYGGRSRGEVDLNYAYLTVALFGMRKDLINHSEEKLKIGFPKLGCGLAGGDWEVVSQIIETIFEGFDVTIYEL